MTRTNKQIDDAYPLSPTQEGILFHGLYAPHSGLYVTQVACTVANLNRSAFEQAWREVTARHPSLRTAFVWKNVKRPLQVVGRRVRIPLEEQDWRGLSPAEQDERFGALLEADRRRGFDFARAPLMRLTLIRLDEIRYRLVWSHHHILLDGWSLRLLIKEVFTIYEGLCRGQPATLPSVPPYREYIAWLERQDIEAAEAFWRQTLQGFAAPTSLSLPDNGRTPRGEAVYAEQRVEISEATTSGLVSLARNHQLTLNTLVQGALAVLLSRYSGREDVVFGNIVAGRPPEIAGVESMVGLFVNTIPSRVRVPRDAKLLAWLKDLQAQQADTRRFEHSPLVKVQGWSEVPRGSALFDTLFAFENYPTDPSSGSRLGAEVSDFKVHERGHYPLTILAGPGERLSFKALYDTSRFDDDHIGRLLEQLRTLLEGILADPEGRLANLPMITAAERQLLAQWNQTARDYPKDKCLHELFEACVDRSPDATALVCGAEQLTYDELNRRANQLARYLRSRGVGQESRVGICMNRSLEMAVAILGVLKAGAAYVPLDPSYPVDRLRFMLEDAGATAILTNSGLAEEVMCSPSLPPVISLDADWPAIAGRRGENLAGGAVPEGAAYVIYTSGSTGRPKGVIVAHRAIVNHMLWLRDYLGLTAADRYLQKTAFNFDASVTEFFAPLITGGRLTLAQPGGHQDPAYLVRTIAEHDVTVFQAVPSLLRVMLEQPEIEACRSLKRVICAGEALPVELNNRFFERLGAELHNLYGPTEAAVDVTSWQCRPDESRRTVPIGVPIANTEIHLLGSDLQPVPVGVAGELYIGGRCLARGYHGQSGLTAERFFPNPFALPAEQGARLYRSGDLARYLPDGTIEYLGRADFQVKIRGFRIELGEIEAALKEHPAVQQAVVVAREDEPGQKRIVACVVPAQGWSVEGIELRRFLEDRLPEYMVPSALVRLDALPLNPNGKVDRKALSAPMEGERELPRAYVAPRTPIEEVLAGIWARILKVDQVSVFDRFVDLGGHSLLAIQVAARVRDAFHVELPLRVLFEEAPTIAGLAERVEELTRRAKRSKSEYMEASHVRKNVQDAYPLSPMQEGILFHSLYAPRSGLYVTQVACTMANLNRSAFERAWQEVTARHPSLRTAFVWKNVKRPLQVVGRRVRIPLEEQDWRGMSPAEQDERFGALLEADRRRGFDFAKAPLMRLTLIRLDEIRYRLVWSHHHILLDGWSLRLLIKEVFTIYEGLCRGQPATLPSVPPYREYIAWLERQDIEAAEAFWRQTLRGFTAPTPMSGGRASDKGSAGEAEYAERRIEIPEATTSALLALTRQHQLTLNTLAQGALAMLLGRYGGEEDVVFGTVVAGRPPEIDQVESMVGLFVNTLPARVKIRQDATLLEWLKELQQEQAEMRRFEYTPLVKIQGWSEVPRGSALFDTLFAFENYPGEQSGEGRLSVEVSDFKVYERDNYPLTILVGPGERLSVKTLYDVSRFDEESIARMLRHFQTLLESFAADPTQHLADLPALPAEERRRLLVEWNDTGRAYPRERCIHELFETQAKRSPDATALVCQDEQLTYRELNRRANRLAHYLRSAGVGPEVLVGVCLERSADLVVAVLAVLKAGGAYVPLDPAYPRERLRFILEDTQAPVLLTSERLLEQLDGDQRPSILPDRCRAIGLEREKEAIDKASDANPGSGADARNLAYVIYTSGSTGRPKGVAIEHRNASALIHWAREVFTPEELASTLFATSACFDLSVFEMFVPLSWGGKVVLAENVLQLPRLPAAEDVTLINTVPSAIAELLRIGGVPRSASTVNLAGEPLQTRLVDELYRLKTVQRVYDLYGPSEDTTYSTFALRRAGGPATIGRPIANTQVYLLDRRGSPVPVGGMGRLYLGGDGLVRGYYGRPELTAEKFPPNPFSEQVGTRLYDTGDLARYLSDGNLEFLGREDHQVKIRGFRIELGEIETALAEHPAVQEAVVVAREDVPGDKRLVAYLVPAGETAPTAGDLRRSLQEKLPDYLVPSAFVILDALPRTPNGKVNRKALPPPTWSRTGEGRAGTPPRDTMEELLADLWADVLGVESVGAEDNFFELGGHSLLATRLVSRIRDALEVELPLSALFEAPTVAALAERLKEAQREQFGLSSPRVEPVPREGPLPLSFAQQRLWFLHQMSPNDYAYNIPGAVRLRGRLNAAALRESLNELVRRHEVLRTTFANVGGRPVQVIASEASVAMPRVDLRELPSAAQEAELTRLAAEEARRPFDLARGPLFRTMLVELGADDHAVLFNMHHIVSDGWSMGVLIQEVATLYEAFSQGRPSPLPALAVQYADYAAWQRRWMQGEVFKRQLAYWKSQLSNSPPVLELPTDRPRPAVQTHRGASHPIRLPSELCQQLRALGRREGATMFMTLLAAFQALLHRYAGQSEILVGTPVAGRTHSELESLIGFFVNTLVLRADFADDPTFQALLRQVRQVALDALAHQDLPFEQLVEALQPDRALSHSPLFQVMFVLQNAPRGTLRLPDLTLTPLPIEARIAKFDLTLAMTETDQGLIGSLEYNTDLFDAATIERMVSHFQTLLERVAADPNQRVAAVPLVDEEESQRLLVEANDTRADYPLDACLHEHFEAQAERTPDAVAVACGAEELTYRELNRRANQLAHHVRRLGVGPEVRVGICMERSLEMVIAMLGVLKAGGAYVPLDPEYPLERLAFMLQDCRAPVLLTQERLVGRLHAPDPASPSEEGRVPLSPEDVQPKAERPTVICVDEAWETLGQESDRNPAGGAGADNPAYIIYTSGSTGRPKGTVISHRAICNHMLWMQDDFPLETDDHVLQKTPISFDASVWEFYAPLLTGSRLVLARPGEHRDSASLVQTIREREITILQVVPSLLGSLLEQPRFQQCRVLRRVFSGGGVLTADLQERFFAALPADLINFYGPTEATIEALAWRCERDRRRPRVPIGRRPISNAQVYLLDRRLAPAAPGVPGQLWIGGVPLARGYLDRPDLTAERFCPNPFASVGQEGTRLYQTGDLARRLPDGTIEFLGRADQQVKLRGFRIELGEIEAALSEHPAVRQAAVVVREDVSGDPRLVAYLACRQQHAPTVTELRDYLKRRLPEYMVPAGFVILDELPLAPNGKVDRRALPKPDFGRPDLKAELVPPRTPTERQLAAIWSELLGVEPIGVYDNFFELGGHSLLATQVVSRVRETFGVELPLVRLFETPVIAELAEKIAQGGEQATDGTKIERERKGEAGIAELIAEVERLSDDEVRSLLAEQ